MIRIDLGREVAPGIFEYSIEGLGLDGRSRQPLLDACRQIERALGSTKARESHAGLYRPGKDTADLHCVVSAGAGLTVSEPASGRIRFSKFQKFDGGPIGRSDTTTATAEAGA